MNEKPAIKYPLLEFPIPFQYRLNSKVSKEDLTLFTNNTLLDNQELCLKRKSTNEETEISQISNNNIKRIKFDNNKNDCLKALDVIDSSETLPNINNSNDQENNNATHSTGDDGESLKNVLLINQDETLPISPLASPSYGFSEMRFKETDGTGIGSEILLQNFIKNMVTQTQLQLPYSAFKNLVFQLISRLDRSELSDLNTLIKDNLKRDFLISLPTELAIKILNNLSFEDIYSCLLTSKNWYKLVKNTSVLWKQLMLNEGLISRDKFKSYCEQVPSKFLHLKNIEDRFRFDFLENRWMLNNWYDSSYKPGRTCLDGHNTSVVTCLQFNENYIITGADDKKINVYDAEREQFKLELVGHEGGVWALKFISEDLLVSGSTDRTVRIWNIKKGICTHVFRGHTSTVRCLDVVESNGIKYIVTGSRDNTLHVWKLPNINVPSYNPDETLVYNNTEENPYFIGVLRGHMASVRTVSGYGNIVISGSYDHNLMVWDITKMELLYVLTGHTDRIYSTLYDHKRDRCISASMDTTIRVWDLANIHNNGPITHINSSSSIRVSGSMRTLCGHTALVGLLGLSGKYLVSAAADGTLRGWDSEDYSRKFSFHHTNLSAITTFYMSDNILVSGSEHQFNVYNLRTGKLVHRHLLSDAEQIWGVKFNNRKLVAAVESEGHSYIEILDFGVRTNSRMTNVPSSNLTA